MAASKRPSFLKRQKEQQRAARALEKREAKRARKQAKQAEIAEGSGPEPEDLDVETGSDLPEGEETVQ
jgi:hypothetical protein